MTNLLRTLQRILQIFALTQTPSLPIKGKPTPQTAHIFSDGFLETIEVAALRPDEMKKIDGGILAAQASKSFS
jgi:hypothetical protein